jgi:RNA binding exosome subunit
LSPKAPIAYIDIRTFAHATEDIDKVQTAMLNALSTEVVDTAVLKKSSLTGHYGNPIVLFQTRIKEKGAVHEVFLKLSSRLSMMDKELLGSEIRRHLEKGNLYLRLDKQSAFMNEIRLCETDPIHFKVHFNKSNMEEVIEICRGRGLVP